jgi:hypothetical protein
VCLCSTNTATASPSCPAIRHEQGHSCVRAKTAGYRRQPFTHSFILSDWGIGPIQVLPRQLGSWYVELVDARGTALGTSSLDRCPTAPKEVRLDGDIVLALRPC